MTAETRIAFFVGAPDEQEQRMLSILRQMYSVYLLENASALYQQMSFTMPELIMFSGHQPDTMMLKLFRRLRRIERICVIVSENEKLYGFVGKKHHRQYSMPQNVIELQRLLERLGCTSSLAQAEPQQDICPNRSFVPSPDISAEP